MRPANTLTTRPESGPHRREPQLAAQVPEAVSGNIDAVAQIYAREERNISRPRNVIERASEFVARPAYLACIVGFVAAWILVNVLAKRFGWMPFDPPPFYWLQGIVGLLGLIVGTAVLIRQNRLARMAEQHAHLDLQVNLLTEQKTSKIIQLLEELRRDLPSVANRHDAEVEEMQKPADPHAVLGAIKTMHGEADGGK
jgi:uncharacterized membrane protein